MNEEKLREMMSRWLTKDEIKECVDYLKTQGKTVYSISRLDNYSNCKMNYFLTYIMGNYGGDSCYSRIGSDVHEHLEMIYKGEETVEQMQEQIPDQIEFTKLFYPFPSANIEKKYCEDIIQFTKDFQKQNYHKTYCERGFIVKIGDSYIQGYIDLTIVNEDGSADIVDYKTSSAYTKEGIEEHSKQLLLYAYAYKVLEGQFPKSISWYMLKYYAVTDKQGKSKEPKLLNRSTWVKDVSSKIKTHLKKLGQLDEMLLEVAIKTNDITILPQEIQDRFKLEEAFVSYPINQETISGMYDYLTNTITEIESRDKDNTMLWQPSRQSADFFCINLCSNYCRCFGRNEEN